MSEVRTKAAVLGGFISLILVAANISEDADSLINLTSCGPEYKITKIVI
jgi:hypothetical protein